ncbi:HTH_Tnp_Tc3_2 domain-containing protein [Trichonephila clavipes]|nr:HTH_Tnp_Tc3_2 domain-containing protein [Trichonephila clavipes]
MALYAQVCGFDPSPSRGIFLMQKIDNVMSYDYAASFISQSTNVIRKNSLVNVALYRALSITSGIIGSTRRVAGQVDRSECVVRNCWEQWIQEGTTRGKPGLERHKTTRSEDRRIVRHCGPTVTRSTIRADVGVAMVPQTISRHLAEENLKSKRPFRALPLTPEHRQLRLQWCQARSMWNVTDWQKRLCLVMNPGFIWEQMITVYGCGGAW